MSRSGILGLGLLAALTASRAVVEVAPQKEELVPAPTVPNGRITRYKAIFALNKMGGRTEYAREEALVRAYIFQLEDDAREAARGDH